LGRAHFKGKWSKQKEEKQKMNLKDKKINAFGKSIPVIAIVLMVLTAGIAGAVLVDNYFKTTSEVTVNPALSADLSVHVLPAMHQGDVISRDIVVTNAANVPILVELGTKLNLDPEGVTVTYYVNDIILSDVDDDELQEAILPTGDTVITARIKAQQDLEPALYEITTNVNPPEGVALLTLENKNKDTWEIINDGIAATLIYTTSGDTFRYRLSGMVLEPDTYYSLIYYADWPERFDNWGGDNPGALIGTVLSDDGGCILDMASSSELGMNLPHADDANADIYEHDYRSAPDFYHNAHGAKLWLVPSGDYDVTGRTIKPNWNPDTYLFETDLISYTDTNA